MCPVRVKNWGEIGGEALEHMRAVAKEHFTHPQMESYKKDVLNHMHGLWISWRSRMNCEHVKNRENSEEILSDVPEFLTKEDWEWCVKEKFLSEYFKKMSKTNEENRALETMNQHSGRRLFDKSHWIWRRRWADLQLWQS